jgi:hypothetical protein
MSYTPVPTGGIEPPHDGATTRCLPTWLSRQNLVAEAGIEPAADEAYETSALPTELFRVLQVAAPLGFEPRPPRSKPGALPARRRGNALVPRAGFEPAPSDLKDRCPGPLDERGDVGAGSENRTRVVCLEGSGSATELCPPRAQGWRGGCAQPKWRMVQGSNLRDLKGLDALAPRCLTARPTIRA